MFLKSLELFGFKSFADRTKIEFSDGITALLGPNGCGKSNVVDAIKWVLGEQASKTMRAEKMEDVIFSGTENRKPLNVAEVTLTIANDNNLLPLDVSEIAIKRRLYRSGESEYFVNSKPSRLKEIRELFWDTGVGKAAYSVMEQGKIDQILSSKPEERRYIFEEAAGITRYKVRGADAERKLARTEENMRQAEGILAEVKRSHDSLKIQAEKTLKYRSLKEEVFENELDIQLLRLKNFSQDRDRKQKEFESVKERRDSAKADIDNINSSLEENMDVVNSMEKQITEFNQEIYGLAIEQKAKVDQAKILNEQKNNAKEKISQLENRKSATQERVESLQEDADEQDSVLHDLTKRISEIEKNISSFEENITLASTQISQNDVEANKLENVIKELDQKRTEMESELLAVTEDIVTELDKRLRDEGYSSQRRIEAEKAVSGSIQELKILLSGRKDIFKDFTGVDYPSQEDAKKYLQTAISAFDDISGLVEKTTENFEKFKETIPGFIDDFLSPEGIITKKRSVDARIQENRQQIAEKQNAIASLKSENTGLVAKIEEYRKTLEDLRLNRVQMQTRIQSCEEQTRLIRRELATQENALKELENELFTENKRLEDIGEQVADIESEISSLEHRGRAITSQLEQLEKDISMRNTDVSSKQETLKMKSAELGKLMGLMEKLNMELATSDTEIKNIKDNFQEQHSRDLMEFEEKMFTITTPTGELRERLAKSRQALKDLGSVNFMAVEEYAEVKDRFDLLSQQLADLQKAREDLQRITQEIRAESTELFLSTYNKIKKNFHNMFRRLFGGGRGELRLVDPNNVLESGIDILAQPPGKKMETIALLSGGEKSMTAVALLFATYMVKPSPFCLLDEIDAALDDQNVLRFVTTLHEFGSMSQYIVITHNKKTVIGSSTLLGITMEESGITKVITIKMQSEPGVHQETLPDIEPFEEEDVEPETDVYIPPHALPRVGKMQPKQESGLEGQASSETEESSSEGQTSSDIDDNIAK